MATSSFWQPRHRAQCILLFLVGLIAYGQHRTPEYWTMWVRLLEFFYLNFFSASSVFRDPIALMIFQAMILIADLMFCQVTNMITIRITGNFFTTLFHCFRRHTNAFNNTRIGRETATEILNSLLFYEFCVM